MAIEDLPDGFTTPSRGEIRDRFQRDYLFRRPGAPIGEGSEAFVDGSVIADALMPLYANAVTIARGIDLEDMNRAQLQARCRALGIPEELPASGGAGFVEISASAGGVYIGATRELKDEKRNLRFRCASADTYYDGKPVPIIGIDVGPNTNLEAGTRLRWSNPVAGLGMLATVLADADGNGLTGGRNAETDDDIRRRIQAREADPPAGGNVAHVRELVNEAGKALGIAIEEVFVYPAILGPGTYAYTFTLRPGSPGSSRIPSNVQIAAVRAYVTGSLPEDDSVLATEILEEPVALKLGVTWAPNAEGWVDAQPWPKYSDLFEVSAVTDAATFRVHSPMGPSETAPTVGKTFAFFDEVSGTFRRKRILSVTALGGSSYDLVIDTSNNASDVNYQPTVGEQFCPYSPSLDRLVEPLLSAIDKLGPGEQVASPFDEGARQRRHPIDPVRWRSSIIYSDLDAVDDLPQVYDIAWLSPSMPHGPTVGVAGASSNMVTASRVLAFKL